MRTSEPWWKSLPERYQALVADDPEILSGGELETGLLQLMAVRAAQLSGCVFCRDRHTRLARQVGVPSEKLVALPVWREAPIYSPRERMALAWTEAVTRADA